MIAVTLPDTAYVVVADYSQGIDSAKPEKMPALLATTVLQ